MIYRTVHKLISMQVQKRMDIEKHSVVYHYIRNAFRERLIMSDVVAQGRTDLLS